LRKLTSWIVVVFILAIGSMLGIHWKQVREMEVGWEYKDRLTERREVAQALVLELEQYRAEAANFRRIPETQVVAAKTRIKTRLNQGINALEQLTKSADAASASNGSPSDRERIDVLRNQFGEYLVLSAKLEPMYYSRNVYQNPEMEKLHDSIRANLEKVSETSKALSNAALQRTGSSDKRYLILLGSAAALATLMLGMILLHTYFRLTRPLDAMRARIREIRSQGTAATKTKPLPGVYGEAEKTLSELVTTVEMHQQDRQRFINAIVTDLRPALTGIETGGNVLLSINERLDGKQRMQAHETVRRSLFRVSGVLGDLTDLLDEDFTRIRLNEKIMDLGELLKQVGAMLGGPGSPHRITVSVPPLPMWASVDPERMERVLINLISKQMLFQPQGGQIHLTLMGSTEEPSDGAEISVFSAGEASRGSGEAETDAAPSGPEQDLLRHWASQSGFGLSLAYKVARAHGGTITAAGVAGMRVLFSVKLPRERIATGILGTGIRTRLIPKVTELSQP